MTADVVDRIQKLLALAEGRGANPHEAALAAARATALMEKHRLSRAALELAADPIGDFQLEHGQRLETWHGVLARRLCATYQCRALEAHWRDKETGRCVGSAYHVVGHKEDVDVVRYLYAYLVREIDRLTTEARRKKKIRGRVGVMSFRMGCLEAVADRVDRAREEARKAHLATGGTTKAIVLVDGRADEVAKWVQERLKPRAGRRSKLLHNTTAHHAGTTAGSAIALHDGIDGAAPGALPEPT